MKDFIMLLLFCTVLSSCATYVDRYSYASDEHELFVFKNNNLFKDLTNNAFNVDTEVYHGNAFAIILPKKIVHLTGGTYDIAEYASKQIIYIIPGVKEDIKKDAKWILRDATDDEIFDYHITNYYDERGYSLNKLDKISDNPEKYNHNREYKVYSNGSTIIFLHNIKKKNYEAFEKCVKSFRYIDRCKEDSQ